MAEHSKALRFQLMDTHTYEETFGLPILCCNEMGNLPLWRGLWGVGHTAFSIQEISDEFGLIL